MAYIFDEKRGQFVHERDWYRDEILLTANERHHHHYGIVAFLVIAMSMLAAIYILCKVFQWAFL